MTMYNKIFTKILDSSVWLEPTPTRIVWITMIAAMDENGFCPFAAVGNVAGRARVTEEEARAAISALESPDKESSDQDNEGRRIERVAGGWLVLNAPKYRAIVTRANYQEKTRARVARFREKKRKGNAPVTQRNESVTPSEAYSDTKAQVQKPSRAKRERSTKSADSDKRHAEFKEAVLAYWKSKNGATDMPWDGREGKALGMFLRAAPHITLAEFTGFLRNRYKSEVNHGDRPSQWLAWITSYAAGPMDRFGKTIHPEGANGANNGKSSSPAKARIDGARRVLARIAVEEGLIDPAGAAGQPEPPVPFAGPRSEHGGISTGLQGAGPEILPPRS